MPLKNKKKNLRKILIALDPSEKGVLASEQLKEDTNENLKKIIQSFNIKVENLKTELLGEFNSYLKKIPNFSEKIPLIEEELNNRIKKLEVKIKEEFESVKSKDELEDKLKDIRKEFYTKLGNIGGGSMPPQININSSVMSTRYSDINLISGSIMSISKADDDTNKRVNITISGSALTSTLEDGKIFVGNASNVATAVAMSGDATIINTGALTLATVNSNVGSFGSATQSPQLTVNAKGLITAVSNVTITPAASSITGGAALTKTDDTNVTLTLGGSPTTALLSATSLTLGWTGQLAVSRGGTGTGTAFTIGSVIFAGASGVYSQDNANFFWDDTNNYLGINTATPRRPLDILKADATPQFRLTFTDNSVYTDFFVNTLGNLIITPTGTAMAINKALVNNTLLFSFQNSDNTNAGSHAQIANVVGGASGGDPTFVMTVSGVQSWAFGLDNSDSDTFKIGYSSVIGGASDSLIIDTSGLVYIGTTRNSAALARQFNIENNTPGWSLYELDGAVDNKMWDFLAIGEDLYFRLVNDAMAVATNWMKVSRTGTTVDSVAFENGNIGIKTTSFGTSAVGVLAFGNGTAPTTSPADITQIWAQDTVAGQSNLYARNENAKSEQITGLRDRVSTQFDKINTTLAAITGLSINVEAGKSYAFKAVLFYDASVVGGHKYSMYGTATATAIIYHIRALSDATNAYVITSRQTALDNTTGVGQAGSTAGLTIIEGLITVNAAGTLTPMFAQNVANGTSSILVGSYFEILPIGD